MKAPLRIKYPDQVAAADHKALAQMSAEAANDYNSYLQRLVKLIPAEAISIYLTSKNLLGETDICKEQPWLPWICLIPVLVVRFFGTRLEVQLSDGTTKTTVEWPMIIISVISYVIWIYANGDCFGAWSCIPNQGAIGVSVLLWTFLVPYIYKSE